MKDGYAIKVSFWGEKGGARYGEEQEGQGHPGPLCQDWRLLLRLSLFTLLNDLPLFMYECLFACIYVHHLCLGPVEVGRVFAAPGVTGSCALPCEMVGTEPRCAARAGRLLIKGPSLQLHPRVVLSRAPLRALKQVAPGWWARGQCVIIWNLA